ncbi:MAG: NUDIX domain-containing protein [Blastocatellia bacterium]
MPTQPKKHGPWTITASRRKYRSDELEVREDEAVGPGGQRKTWAVVKIKPGVTILPVDDDRMVYLTREFRYAAGRECLEAVSGVIEEGETPVEAARRELREKLNLEAGRWIDLGRVDPMTSQIDSSTTLFLASGLSFVKKKDGVRASAVRMPLNEAVGRALGGEITHGASCVLLFRAYYRLMKRKQNDQRIED